MENILSKLGKYTKYFDNKWPPFVKMVMEGSLLISGRAPGQERGATATYNPNSTKLFKFVECRYFFSFGGRFKHCNFRVA
jgi:hypothetical protein